MLWVLYSQCESALCAILFLGLRLSAQFRPSSAIAIINITKWGLCLCMGLCEFTALHMTPQSGPVSSFLPTGNHWYLFTKTCVLGHEALQIWAPTVYVQVLSVQQYMLTYLLCKILDLEKKEITWKLFNRSVILNAGYEKMLTQHTWNNS